MPNAIPTITELYNAIKSDLESRLSGPIPIFGKGYIRARAGVQAGKLWLLYVALGKYQRNQLPDLAESETAGGTLERWIWLKLNRGLFKATQAVLKIIVTGTAGAVLKAGLVFRADDDSLNPGKKYILDTEVVMGGTSETVEVRALEAGTSSRQNAGDTMSATEPIPGADGVVVVHSVTSDPIEDEAIEDARDKVVEAFRLEPQGGAAADYRLWGKDAAGVKQIYPYASSGAPNEVDIYVEATVADSTDDHGTPTPTILAEVAACIELNPDTTLDISRRGRRPLGVFAVNVLPVTPKAITINIPAFTDLTAAKEALILAAVKEGVDAVRPFIGATDVLSDKNDLLDKNKIASLILTAVPGASFGDVEMQVDSVITASQTFANGNIPFLDAINYV